MTVPHQNWQSLGAGGMYGANTTQGGTGFVVGRSELDSLRIGEGFVPGASYPDGYLGTIRTRRDDRLLDSIKSRENQKAYQRGVHKGERIDPSDYYWPGSLNPQRGLMAQLRGAKRQTPLEQIVPRPQLINDGKAPQTTEYTYAGSPSMINPVRASQLSSLRPTWR